MMKRVSGAISALVVLLAQAGSAVAQEAPVDAPRLVTFGSRALQNEGDHDFRQLVRISVPENSGRLHLRVFDPDVGGRFDEAQRGFNTSTRFSLYGANAAVRLFRDGEGVVQEEIAGEALVSTEYGYDESVDGQWVTLFSVDATGGMSDGARREFVLAVEGLNGDDGNVFDVTVSRSHVENVPVDGARLTSFAPTLQVADDGQFAELRFVIPRQAESLIVENFDAAGGGISYAGQFYSAPLTASGKSEWQRDRVELKAGEAGRPGSVIASGGDESPNDVTIVVSVPAKDPDKMDQPVAIELPVRTVSFNARPTIYFNMHQNACGEMTFNASSSFDADGGTLNQHWQFDDSSGNVNKATLVRGLEEAGDHRGRLEVFDDSGVVANGRALDFSFYVKPPPIAAFDAPELVAQGAEVRFDATGSKTRARPTGNRITRYHWRMGDGGEIVQNEGDPDFGRPVYRFTNHGNYDIELTVTDLPDAACNTATTTRSIVVNAPPEAQAGGDRKLLTGEIGVFDATKSHDPDGSIASYWWDFGDGKKVFGPTTRHTFHRPGTYPVRLTVIDDTVYETAADTDVITVTVRDEANARPTASVGENRVAAIGETVTFDGSGSADPDGRILFYLWDFGNGFGDDEPVVRHTYWEPGTYTVHLTVKDDNEADGGQSVDTMSVDVVPAENRAPVLDFAAELVTTLHVPVLFDASGANDRDGTIISYEWEFGDGATGRGAKVHHRYEKPGVYQGKLILTDNGIPQPQKSVVEFAVNVTGKANTAPSPVIQAVDEATAGQSVAFNAGGSSDPDGSIRSFEWDFGDGNRATGIETTHVYQFPGRYDIQLTITDDDIAEQRLSVSSTHVLEIKSAQNAPPTARAGSNLTVARGEVVQFDGSASSDADGNIMAYDWKFGDGGQSPDARPVHAFHDVGTFAVDLTVTDDGSPPLSGNSQVVVTVIEPADGEASQ